MKKSKCNRNKNLAIIVHKKRGKVCMDGYNKQKNILFKDKYTTQEYKGENNYYDKSIFHLPRQYLAFLKKSFKIKVFEGVKIIFMPDLCQII